MYVNGTRYATLIKQTSQKCKPSVVCRRQCSPIKDIKIWWDHINTLGPKYGYHTNASNWLITKEDHLTHAETSFESTGVKIITEGRPYLGVPLGTEDYIQSHLRIKVDQWAEEMDHLATIAHTQPHAAYAAFTHGMASKWLYLSRTMSGISTSLQPMEHTIRTMLIPDLTGRPPPNGTERTLLALPARLGGLALAIPTDSTDTEYWASKK